MKEKISKLLDYLGNNDTISKRTFEDLNLSSVFKLINHTSSKVGEQYLYYSIYNLKSNTRELVDFENKIKKIKNFTNKKEIKKKLSLLNKNRSYNLVDTIFTRWLNLPYWWYSYAPLLVILLLSNIIGFFILPKIFIYSLILLPSTYLMFHIINKGYVYYAIEFFQNLNDFISVISYVNANNSLYKFNSHEQFKKNTFLINILLINEVFDKKNMIFGVISFFIDLIKGLFLIDILIINYLQKKITLNKNFELDFLKLGELDTILSIIELRKNKKVCIPFYKENTLTTKEITHPIVKKCISNSIDCKDKSVLITGANMSGKTTFIKSIGVNLILARSINTCFAVEFIFDFFDVVTSIDVKQDLEKNKSYFKVEVDLMNELIEKSETKKSLFIIDEIFKGTNTKERVALSLSILKYLSKNKNFVFVTTHDVELTKLLKNDFNLYHFDFKVENGDINFDYKIKNGAIIHNYALELVKTSGIPEIIIKNAEKYLKESEKQL